MEKGRSISLSTSWNWYPNAVFKHYCIIELQSECMIHGAHFGIQVGKTVQDKLLQEAQWCFFSNLFFFWGGMIHYTRYVCNSITQIEISHSNYITFCCWIKRHLTFKAVEQIELKFRQNEAIIKFVLQSLSKWTEITSFNPVDNYFADAAKCSASRHNDPQTLWSNYIVFIGRAKPHVFQLSLNS